MSEPYQDISVAPGAAELAKAFGAPALDISALNPWDTGVSAFKADLLQRWSAAKREITPESTFIMNNEDEWREIVGGRNMDWVPGRSANEWRGLMAEYDIGRRQARIMQEGDTSDVATMFGAQFVGALLDPVNVALVPLGIGTIRLLGRGAKLSTKLAKLYQLSHGRVGGAIGGTVGGIAAIPFDRRINEMLGKPFGMEEMALSIGSGLVLGSAFDGVRAMWRKFAPLRNKATLLEATAIDENFDNSVLTEPSEVIAQARSVERLHDQGAMNPATISDLKTPQRGVAEGVLRTDAMIERQGFRPEWDPEIVSLRLDRLEDPTRSGFLVRAATDIERAALHITNGDGDIEDSLVRALVESGYIGGDSPKVRVAVKSWAGAFARGIDNMIGPERADLAGRITEPAQMPELDATGYSGAALLEEKLQARFSPDKKEIQRPTYLPSEESRALDLDDVEMRQIRDDIDNDPDLPPEVKQTAHERVGNIQKFHDEYRACIRG